jgi:hypothetical protein
VRIVPGFGASLYIHVVVSNVHYFCTSFHLRKSYGELSVSRTYLMCTCRDHGSDRDALDSQGGYYLSPEIVFRQRGCSVALRSANVGMGALFAYFEDNSSFSR